MVSKLIFICQKSKVAILCYIYTLISFFSSFLDPNPVRNLTISDTTNTTVILAWQPPIESLFTHYIVR